MNTLLTLKLHTTLLFIAQLSVPHSFLNYGIHPRTIPLQVLSSNNPSVTAFLENIQESTKFAQENIQKQNIRMAEYANKSRLPHNFAVNDKVWLSTKNLSIEDGSGSRKLHPKFCGPFVIKEKISEVTFRLALSEPMKARGIHDAFHVSLLKPFVEDTFQRDPAPEPAVHFADGHQEYEVEAILSHRKRRGKIQYLVKWKGYADHENTWQSTKDLENAKDILEDYKASSRCFS